MNKVINFIKNNKIFSILILAIIFSFILGLLFLYLLDDISINMIRDSINVYFNNINTNNISYFDNFKVSIINNISLGFIIWILGISIIGVVLVIFILFAISFSNLLSIFSIIYVYEFKGILYGLIYMIPCIINMVCFFIISFYSVSFSVLLFRYLFKGFDISRKVILKKYFKLLLVVCFIFIFSSVIEVFLVPRIILLF